MNKWFDTWMTKRNVLVGSLFLAILPYVFTALGKTTNCNPAGCGGFGSDFFFVVFPLAVIIAAGTLLIYMLRDEVFKLWIRLAFVWSVVAGVWIALTPHNTQYALNIDQKPMLVFSLSLAFIFGSLLVILIKSVLVYSKKK